MKLKVNNNWEYLTYSFKDEKVDEKKGGTVVLKGGEIVKYKSVKTSASYTDWGRTYSTPCYYLVAKINFNNQLIEIRLEALDLEEVLNTKVKRRKYKLNKISKNKK